MATLDAGGLGAQSEALAGLVEGAAGGVVGVQARRRGGGSGVVWNSDGVVVTAAHVLERDDTVTVTRPDGTDVEAHVVGVDAGRDVAVLRAPSAGLTPLAQGTLEGAKVGHLVLSLARPGKTVRARLGILSALGGEWQPRGGGKVARYVESDAGRAPGFSGGALLDVQGRLLGMNTSGVVRMASVAIPVVTLSRIVEELLQHGRLRRAWMGVAMQPTRLQNRPEEIKEHNLGLLITHVENDSPAHKAGILVGDILVSMDHDGVQSLDELNALFTSENIGKTLTARLLRGGELRRVSVTLAGR